RPTLYGSFHRLWPARAEGGMPEIVKNDDKSYDALDTEIVDVVGPVCESGDFFAKNRPLPKVKEGTILAIFDTGAYGFSMSSNYNSRPRVCEVIVSGGKSQLARRRETYEDLIEKEKTVT
ncbi:MAG: diaminopimelate decarboxylase, partial [Planctomycetes bacterium]|nr:diaminopimelate decarboxylase [Planctomycetota bacterium]